MREVVSAGGIILDGREILLIQHKDGLGFPKGHVEEESEEDAAVREVLEETGLHVKPLRQLGKPIVRESVDYPEGYHSDAVGEVVSKKVVLFLMEVLGTTGMPPESGEVSVKVDIVRAVDLMKHAADARFILEEVFPLVGVDPKAIRATPA